MLIIDLDDFSSSNSKLDLLDRLYDINKNLKLTLFTVPFETPYSWLDDVAKKRPWIQFAVHGYTHATPRECLVWDTFSMKNVMRHIHPPYSHVFKAPGWNLSDACYDVLTETGWILADHPKNAERRQAWVRKGLKIYDFMEHGLNAMHGHMQNVCHNGLEEYFKVYEDRVRREHDFRWISEVAS